MSLYCPRKDQKEEICVAFSLEVSLICHPRKKSNNDNNPGISQMVRDNIYAILDIAQKQYFRLFFLMLLNLHHFHVRWEGQELAHFTEEKKEGPNSDLHKVTGLLLEVL